MSELVEGTQAPMDGQTASAPEGQAAQSQPSEIGQAIAEGSVGTGQAQAPGAEDSFFDPNNVPPELQGAYKQMQAAFTKKTQSIAAQRQEMAQFQQVISAYRTDPIGTLQQLAAQHGMSLTRGQAAQMMQQQGQEQQQDDWESFQPNSWKAVRDRLLGDVEQELFQKWSSQFAPVVQSVQTMQARNVEAELNKLDPNWKLYESEMMDTLREHPTLVKNVEKLYMLSVPKEVWASRGAQQAMKKVQAAVQAAGVAGPGTTSKTVAAPKKAGSFAEAVELAKSQLAEQGIRP